MLAVAATLQAMPNGGGEEPCSDECPLTWTQTLTDSSVECADELPTTCEEFLSYASAEGLAAANACTGEEVALAACFPLASESEALPVTVCNAKTAKRDLDLEEGEYDSNDGAVRLYGLSAMGLADSDYFVEDPSNPLQFQYAPDSRSARLTGTVHCVLNANQIFHVDARFVNEDNAADWLAESTSHTLLIADDPEQSGYQTCAIDTSAISVFDLQVMSRLTGAGEYDGTLFIDHMPMSYAKRFQLGEGANNHNCNYGFGGWFRWEGALNGQDVSGLSGDIVVDLACTENEAECDEYAQFLFEAIDDCGRILSQLVTVERDDVTAPTILDGPADVTVECDEVPAMTGPEAISATDNCEGDLDISEGIEVRYDGACPHSYILDRRWTVTDVCGNSSVHVQLVTVQDTEAPQLTVPADYVAECDEELVYDDAAAEDNCGDVALEEVQATVQGDCTGNYVITRTFTATDECGNSTTATQTITVQDTTAPEFTSVPADYTVECSDEMPMGDAAAADNCGPVTVEVETLTTSGACAGDYTITRTFTATDDCGNSTSATQTITVQDTTAPELSIPADYTAECNEDHPLDAAYASDNCGEVTLEEEADTTYSCAHSYVITRTFTATDDCGNSSTASQTITIQDTTAPELTIPGDYTAECSEENPLMDASALDNCDEEVSISVVVDTLAGDCPQAYTVTRSFTATDACGNSTSATQTIVIEDTTAPTFNETLPADETVECDAVPAATTLTAMDNCQEVSVSFSEVRTDGSCDSNYTLTRTWTVSDDCGNETAHTQTVTVQDTTAPMFNEALPADETVECDAVTDAAVLTAFDNCQDVTVAFNESRADGSCDANYVLTRTWTVQDDCGNASSHTQTVTVQDTTSPDLTIPADYTAECSDEHPLEDASATDNCGDAVIELAVDTTYTCVHSYVVTRQFTATDECGNSTTATQTITIEDTTAPVVEGEVEVFISCENYDVAESHATASDNCGAVTLTWEDNQASGGCVVPVGQYVRVYTAVDECGNESIFEQILTLTDEVAPVFTEVPDSYTAECIDDLTYGDASATDNCSGMVLTLEVDTVWSDCEATYDIVRTWTATDNCDNVATAVQTISVVDTEGPWFTYVPDDYTADCTDELDLDMATAEDHCSSFIIDVHTDTLPGPCAGQFVILREFVATDACGNSSETTQVIMVEDNTAPEFTFVPEDYTAECDAEQPMLDAEAIDACGEVTISYDQDMEFGDCYSSYTLTRMWTATDDCGNSSSVSQVITIVDTTAPDFMFVPADYSVECTEEVTYEDATALDNCAGLTLDLMVDTNWSECDNVYDIVRTWTATDGCGNASTASQTISVVDTTAPHILNSCGLMNQEVIEVCCEAMDGSVTVPAACEITFDDNCGQEATVVLEETYSGEFAPTADVDRWCVISEPEALANGDLCDGFAPHGMHLFNFPGGDFYNTLSGTVAHHVDSTMTYTMELVSADNPDAGWTVVTEYTAPMSWADWTGQPGVHSYKSDCGLGDHTTWQYAMMTSGQATGWGDFEDDSFVMMQQPANGYFGFQIGEGANNKNANYGFSGWFYLTGTVGGQTINSSGDLFGELDCCQPWTLERAYTVTDCAGNATTFTYEIHATGVDCEAEDEGGISEGEDTSLVMPKELIQLLDIQPNPSNGMVQFQILSEEVGADVDVRLVSMAGEDVMAIYEGLIWEDIAQTVLFDVSNVDAGMYQIRLTSKNFMTTKKLLVVH